MRSLIGGAVRWSSFIRRRAHVAALRSLRRSGNAALCLRRRDDSASVAMKRFVARLNRPASPAGHRSGPIWRRGVAAIAGTTVSRLSGSCRWVFTSRNSNSAACGSRSRSEEPLAAGLTELLWEAHEATFTGPESIWSCRCRTTGGSVTTRRDLASGDDGSGTGTPVVGPGSRLIYSPSVAARRLSRRCRRSVDAEISKDAFRLHRGAKLMAARYCSRTTSSRPARRPTGQHACSNRPVPPASWSASRPRTGPSVACMKRRPLAA